MAAGTKGRILDALAGMLEVDPDPTYGAIAKQAGVSRQMLYTHFPTRGALLVGFADRERSRAQADQHNQAVFTAPTARDALDALVDVHLAITPRIMNAVRLVEHARASDPAVDEAFTARPTGRRQLVRHVMTRLHAERLLSPTWSVDTATDLVDNLIGATLTHELMKVRRWTADELGGRLRHTLHRTLTVAPEPSP